jgi:hypothetical protein
MSCPNNNKVFDGSLFDSGLIDKNLSDADKAYQRRRVYYTICIMIRLAIAGLVLQLKDKEFMPYLLAVISIYPIISLGFYRTEDNQWWSDKFQLAIAIALLVASVLLIFKVNIPTYIPALILFISVFGGVFQSLLIPSC